MQLAKQVDIAQKIVVSRLMSLDRSPGRPSSVMKLASVPMDGVSGIMSSRSRKSDPLVRSKCWNSKFDKAGLTSSSKKPGTCSGLLAYDGSGGIMSSWSMPKWYGLVGEEGVISSCGEWPVECGE